MGSNPMTKRSWYRSRKGRVFWALACVPMSIHMRRMLVSNTNLNVSGSTLRGTATPTTSLPLEETLSMLSSLARPLALPPLVYARWKIIATVMSTSSADNITPHSCWQHLLRADLSWPQAKATNHGEHIALERGRHRRRRFSDRLGRLCRRPLMEAYYVAVDKE